MNRKKWIKKSSALLLAFCMVVSIVLQHLPMISKASNESPTPESMGYTTRIDLDDFTKTEGTIAEKYEAGTSDTYYVGDYTGTSLSGTYLDVDISISSTNWSDALYFGSTNGWYGIAISIRSGELFVKDAQYASQNEFYDLVGLGLVDTINDEFNLKLGLKQGTDATYAIWVNDVFLEEKTLSPTSATGTKLAVRTNTGYVTIKSAVDQRIPEDLGYTTRVTLGDFTKAEGTIAEKYEVGTSDTYYVGNYTGTSLNGTYLDVDVSFKNYQDSVYFGSSNGWNGIEVTVSGGELFVRELTNRENKTYDIVGDGLIDSLDQPFNLKLGLKQDTKTTVAIWVEDTFVAEYTFANSVTIGNKLAVRLNGGGYVTIKSGIDTRTPEELGYEKITVQDFGLDNGTYYSDVVYDDHYTGSYGDASLNMKYLDIDTSFEVGSSNSHINYGGNDGWHGIRIFGMISDGNEYLIIKDAGTGNTNQEYNLTKKGISIHEPFNIKLATKYVENTQDGTDVTYTLWLNNECIGSHTFTSMPRVGNMIGICAKEGNINIGTYTEKTLSPVSYDLSDGAYLVSGTKVSVYKDDELLEDVTSGTTITTPGDYTIKRTDNLTKYTQNISLYKMGDVNCDGEFSVVSDLAALQELLSGKTSEYKATSAAEYAADLDNDGNVGSNDLKLMQNIQSNTTTLEDVLDKYHVPALTYDYLGGDEVMPINGFYGPHNRGTNNYITEEVFQLIKESGVNLITYSRNKINSAKADTSILDAIALAEKYGLGYYVDDARLNTEITLSGEINSGVAALDQTTLAKKLSVYSHYENYLGTFLVDEPYPNVQAYDSNYKQLQYYDGVSKLLNGFANNNAFISAWPSYASWNNSPTSYDDYLKAVVDDTDAKVLSFDHYVFEPKTWGQGQGAHNAESYFTSLSAVRNVAKEKNIPFWGYVQAGGDFRDGGGTGATDSDKQPTEAETYWNVNTLLAFGAKGIGWFPLVQPEDYAYGESEEAVKDYDRNGLLGSNATTAIESDVTKWTTPFYEYAKNINKHIAAIDEVLMKAKSTAIIATGGYAKSETQDAGVTLDTSTEKLQSVATDNSEYGALVGCFDYRDTEAFYVVNYDVTTAQEITLTFDKNYDYRQIQDAKTTFGAGKIVTLTIPAGEAVLIVLEDRMVEVQDISEYRGATADANKAPDAEAGYVFGGWYEVTPEDLGYTTRVTLEDFTTEQGTVAEKYEAGDKYVGRYHDTSLNATYLDVDVSFANDSKEDKIMYGATGEWYGLAVSVFDGVLEVRDSGVGNTAKSYDIKSLGLVDSVTDEFNMKLGIKQGDTLTYALWVEDVLLEERTLASTSATGNKMVVRTSTGYVTIKSGVDKRTPEDLGYTTRVTLEDFTTEQGTVAEKYEAGTTDNLFVGNYTGTSLNGTYLDVNISISSTDWSDALYFGSTNGWNGIAISIRSGELFVKDAQHASQNEFYNLVSLGLVKTINDEFNLKLGLKQGTDATYAIWVNDVFLEEKTLSPTSATGTKLAVRTSTGYVTIKSSIEPNSSEGRIPLASYKTSGVAYAKFVDEDVLTVKTQITADTTATSEKADIRFVTTVDSLNYDEVGFLVTPQGGEQVIVSSAFAYEKLYGVAADSATLERDDFLAQYGPQSRYFVTYSCADVLKDYFGNTYTLVPYWKTQDGTIVYGDKTETSISMGIGIQTEAGTGAPWSTLFAANAEVVKENLNGDGILSDADLMFLRNGLLSDTVNERYDINSDETMDVKDLVRLKKSVVNFDERDGLFAEVNPVAIAQWGDLL